MNPEQFTRDTRLRRNRFQDPHSTATLRLGQGVKLIVIKELSRHVHIGVAATVYARVRLGLQRQAIDTLGAAHDVPTNDESTRDNGDDPSLCGATVC